MDEYEQFDSDLASCRKCADILQRYFVDPCASITRVEPRPIVSGIRGKPILLVGQSPGIKEYESGKPFQGQAGQTIRGILRELGVHDFDKLVFSSAVVKCYPGRKFRKKDDPTTKCEDRVPPAIMVNNCKPFLVRQVALVDPQVVLTMGSVSSKSILRLAGQYRPNVLLENYVGTSSKWGHREIICFPHTSTGARWLNSSDNRALFVKAKELLRSILLRRGIVGA